MTFITEVRSSLNGVAAGLQNAEAGLQSMACPGSGWPVVNKAKPGSRLQIVQPVLVS